MNYIEKILKKIFNEKNTLILILILAILLVLNHFLQHPGLKEFVDISLKLTFIGSLLGMYEIIIHMNDAKINLDKKIKEDIIQRELLFNEFRIINRELKNITKKEKEKNKTKNNKKRRNYKKISI